MQDTKKNIKAIMTIVVLGIGGKMCGLLRSIFMAKQFGTTKETDAFLAAWAGTILITSLLGASVSHAVVIVLEKIKGDKEKKIKTINNILNIIVALSIIAIIVFYLLAPGIIRILSKGFEGEQYYLTIKLFRIGLPAIGMFNIAGCMRGYLNVNNSFTEFGLIYYTQNLTVIIYILLFADKFGIVGMMVAQVIGVFTQLIVQMPFLKKTKYKYEFIFKPKNKEISDLVMIITPIFLGVAVNDLNVIVDKTMASELIPGSITALEYGNKINELFFHMLVAPITRVMLPVMAAAFNKNETKKILNTISNAMAFISVIALPAMAGIIILANPIVSVLFGRGKFGNEAISMSATAMMFYAIGLVAEAGNLVINKIFYSMSDTKTPFKYTVLTLVCNVIFNIIFIRYLDLGGLALSTSVSSWIVFILMSRQIRKKIKYKKTHRDVKIQMCSIITTVIMGSVMYRFQAISYIATKTDIYKLAASIVIGGLTYAICMAILMRKECIGIIKQLKNK